MVQIGFAELFFVLGAVGFVAVLFTVARALIGRHERRSALPEADPAVHNELSDLRERLLEAEERLDAAEQTLRRERERNR